MLAREQTTAIAIEGDASLKKPSAADAARMVARRMLHPRHTVEWLKHLRKKPQAAKAVDDAQLKLYSEILPGDFLNYGYFDDPDIAPEKISLHDIQQAQIRYGQLLIDQIKNKNGTVLDAGCGMGGLLNLLVEQGFSPVALTPNRAQIKYISTRHPAVPMIQGKFEDIPVEKFRRHFDTVITSESFQYVNLAAGLATMERILAPGGRWILCDYFRTTDRARKSGHLWTDFLQALEKNNWRVVSEKDITRHALPAVGFVYMCGRRIGVPVAAFALGKLRRKRPALHYLFEEVIEKSNAYLLDQLELVNPETFAREKKYALLVIERR
jgi:cyclopropane fatty-acyl-phospholipid synthase-like methyltransferase